jgi:hypothetical protein
MAAPAFAIDVCQTRGMDSHGPKAGDRVYSHRKVAYLSQSDAGVARAAARVAPIRVPRCPRKHLCPTGEIETNTQQLILGLAEPRSSQALPSITAHYYAIDLTPS